MAQDEDYRKTKTYQAMDNKTKKLLAQYKRENHVSNEQLFYQLYLMDLEETPKVNVLPMIVAVVVCVLAIAFIVYKQADNQFTMVMAIGVVILTFIMFLVQTVGNSSAQKSAIRSYMTELPEVQSFEDWLKAREE